jgi:YfiH family protein
VAASGLAWGLDLRTGRASCRFSTRREGDLRVTLAPDELASRRAGFVDLPWVALTQVHGASVVVRPAADDDRAEADALVTDRPGLVLSVNVADCAPIALMSPQGIVGAVHAGWRGVEAGVIGAAAEAMRELGAVDIAAWVGPCIHAECYEFGSSDLDRVVARVGPGARSRARDGQSALDLPMAVARELGRSAVRLAGSADACTACDGAQFFSHRARADDGRHALAVWIDEHDS